MKRTIVYIDVFSAVGVCVFALIFWTSGSIAVATVSLVSSVSGAVVSGICAPILIYNARRWYGKHWLSVILLALSSVSLAMTVSFTMFRLFFFAESMATLLHK
jgi:hypothetical protein